MSDELCVSDVSFGVGTKSILEDVSFSIKPGQCVAIVGPNGAGKSTLFKAILGLLKPAKGTVSWGDKEVAKMRGRERASVVGWLPQHGLIQEAVPAVELVRAARFRFSEGRRASVRAAINALTIVGVEALADRAVTTLSGGELQRVMMATLVAQDARVLLLDEPANHLDPAHQIGFYDLICKQWTNGRGVAVITHDINLLTQLAPAGREEELRVIGLKEGSVAFQTSIAATALGAL